MNYRLIDLIDIELLQAIINRFSDVTGIATTIIDHNGAIITGSGWQSFCSDFHFRCPVTQEYCQMNFMHRHQLVTEERYVTRECRNGLIYYAAAINIDGNHLGTIITGQVLHNDPDPQRYLQQARQFGFDEEAYLEALSKVKVVAPQHIEKTLRLLADLTRLLAQIGLERKQRLEAERELLASEERLMMIIESSNDGFWIWEEDNTIVMTPRCAEILEFHTDKMDEVSWLSSIHPGDVHQVLKHLKDHLAGYRSYISTEYRMQTKQGKWKWIHFKARVTRYNHSGYPSQVAGSISDISERKQFEANLLESESLYRSLVETSPSAIVLTDRRGIIKFINSQGLIMSGWKAPAKLVGQSGLVLLRVDQWGRMGLDYRQIIEAGCCKQGEYTCIRRDGSTFIAELSIAPIYNAHQHLSGCIIIAQDITARKAMELELLQHRNHLQKLVEQKTKALRLSEEKFAKAFTASPVAMSITTLEDGRCIEVNDAFCDLMGYKREELIGKSFMMIWNIPEKRHHFKQLIKEQGLIKDYEFNFVTRSGKVRVGLISGQYIQLGEDTYILSSINDITEKRRIDREMERLDRLNLIGEMAASIGHEIRNPMTTVRGLLQMLSSNELYTADRDLFELMIEELDRANSIITEFLSLAKNKHVELLPGNLSRILESVIPLIQAHALSHDIRVDYQPCPVPDILLDDKEIRQLILNLTQNALDAMENGGTLTLGTFEEKGQVILMVQDEGPGIDEVVLDKIGLPFVTTKENGTGLGLSVCYRIAARHNAAIDVETSCRGTTFYVRFPRPLEQIS